MSKARTWQQLALFAVLLSADQLSKAWIEQQMPFFQQTVIPGCFDLVKAHNFGVAFSMFADWSNQWRTTLLLGVTIGIAAAVSVWWWQERHRAGITSWLLVLIMAGAAGNIWDRVHLGYVVDFIDWYITWNGSAYHWPAFNIADACISVSVVLLLLFGGKKA
ncbi:MAG: signal peptidase II [Zetaproteobacteria bacterium CG06_land_8_20_14_3_00_59_53]|nr:MAG: signal peptidase II [Zetaproteobacteria bacterium CG2_30_59_37]PIO90304.1 MAG: signal peptidase II [Zetaproteobacteria bacterium CG23_combo_of_CG06-09_8_20_14_all_59_86]PIQ64928.1 MAG: signal peptidase II [Zetaproteobacteria bacterium CG11_big_fil_rev_8_21_14_0_20_59_439]PIU69592.1 MAG: signal peptidase II [Zetaproteobacteria bacterium CG06_land_8_20_14_3_00_59_53]PIU95925.1 MAG: signal peptidase II [Zetaproteobacteria bacterium CG03_land_8_20_14_0_80_59_51]PIY47123.1 MAG: signal pepti